MVTASMLVTLCVQFESKSKSNLSNPYYKHTPTPDSHSNDVIDS